MNAPSSSTSLLDHVGSLGQGSVFMSSSDRSFNWIATSFSCTLEEINEVEALHPKIPQVTGADL